MKKARPRSSGSDNFHVASLNVARFGIAQALIKAHDKLNQLERLKTCLETFEI